MERSEILVHISAPCGRSDDARYRAQIEAILGFQSASRQMITSLNPDGHNNHDDTISAATTDGLSQSWLPSTTTSLKESVTSPNGLPNNLAIILSDETIVSGNRQRPNGQPHSCYQEDLLESPVSVIPDSQPGRPSSDPDNLQDVDHPLSINGPHSFSCSPSASPIKRYQANSPSPKPRDGLKRPRPNERRTDESITTQIGDFTVQSTPLATSLRTNFPVPAEIKPPLPPISNGQFSTHITPTLEMLATRLERRTYRPLHQTRELDKLERGHWYLRINITELETYESIVSVKENSGACNWDMSMFSRFWSFLTEFIKEGRAGWGVWCILEDMVRAQLPRDVQRPSLREANTRQLTLKAYAWGEIASHIYLLLFLASERRVRKMGAQWRDGRDDVVIQMP
ncbi:hypothetical protein BDV28DRAFT_137190 [Aspergillus coremiiformis]|uniref:Uncharacterized protein n=1 Tax=Aspergillus coremiiformis TaxID=138285 RepID=A0A5N6Z135_9EURO|nr:hypothetical protein BDV28DRAFT_137190 [Aspergillus coremiiformis]